MKKIAIAVALLLGTQIAVNADNTTVTTENKQPSKASQNEASAQKPAAVKQSAPAKQEEFLLKYNINDLEVAPWLNNGVRKI